MRSIALVSTLFLVVGCHFEGQSLDPRPDAADRGPKRPDGPPRIVDAPGTVDPCPGDGDDDGDGICNSVDDWPCGAKPSDPDESRAFDREPDDKTHLNLGNIRLDNQDRLMTILGTTQLHVSAHFSITDTECDQNCIDQIEFGFAPARTGCMWDGQVDRDQGASGDATGTLTAPYVDQPTLFELRVRIGKNFSCTYHGASDWYYGEPGRDHTIAYVCAF